MSVKAGWDCRARGVGPLMMSGRMKMSSEQGRCLELSVLEGGSVRRCNFSARPFVKSPPWRLEPREVQGRGEGKGLRPLLVCRATPGGRGAGPFNGLDFHRGYYLEARSKPLSLLGVRT